jgi:RNA polymerase sigma-70 factor, ECF subfamily
MATAASDRSDGDEDPAEAVARAAWTRGGPRALLPVLMDAYGDRIYRFCRAFLGDRDLAAEAHQQVFISAHETLAAGPVEIACFASWLVGIARHRCLDASKARRRWRARFRLGETTRERADAAPAADQVVDGQRRQHALVGCLAGLAPHVRLAVLMRHLEGMSFDEMARVCRERPPTLQARVARALPLLRRCLETKGWSAP